MSASLIFLGVCTFALEAFLLAVLIKRKLRSEFPAFTNFIVFNLLLTVVIQVCTRWFWSEWAYVYWSATAISMLLCFWILYEVFIAILKPYSAIIDLGKMLFRWAALFLLLAGLITAFTTTGSQFNKFCTVVILLEHCVQLMQCGLLLLLLAFESRLGLSWRSHAMSLGLGIGLFAAWDLTVTYVGAHFPANRYTLDILNGLVSLGTYGYWGVTLLLPEPQRRTVLDSPSRLIFQRWNEGLLGSPLVAVHRNELMLSPVDSFLPGVEKTVDRVLARKMSH